MEPPEIHDLLKLNGLCATIDKQFEDIAMNLTMLNAYAVNFRYPGESATIDDANHACSLMSEVRDFVRKKLAI
jgi:HEPN domain-containing protein